MKGLLIIGDITDRMKKQFTENFRIFRLNEIEDFDKFLKDHGDEIEAIATNGHDGVPDSLFDQLNSLKIISCFGVGYDAIDVKKAKRRGIVVTHTPNVLNADVANLAILLILATSRCLLRYDRWVRDGSWMKLGNAPLTHSIEKSKVGIVGLGRIGLTIANKLKAFNCDIAYHSRSKKSESDLKYFADLVQMAGWAEYLIVIVPGTVSTYRLIDQSVIDALGPKGTLINISRGSVVDEAALRVALKDGRLGAAGLDVFENEPEVPPELSEMENVVLTPHVASATFETRKAMGDLVVENLILFFQQGKALTPVPQ